MARFWHCKAKKKKGGKWLVFFKRRAGNGSVLGKRRAGNGSLRFFKPFAPQGIEGNFFSLKYIKYILKRTTRRSLTRRVAL